MPRRRTRITPARELLADRVMEQVVVAEVRHSVLAHAEHGETRAEVMQSLREAARSGYLTAIWIVDTGDEVLLRIALDGTELGAIAIEATVAPLGVGWECADEVDFDIVMQAQADVTALARRIIAREAGLETGPARAEAAKEPSSWDYLRTDDEVFS